MAKRVVAKVGTYTNQQGETKGEYQRLGVMMQSDNGEYMLLDPCINLAGVLIKQNALAAKEGKQQRDMVMISIFDDNNQQQGQQQGWGQPQQSNNGQPYQQQAPQQRQQQQRQQGSQVPQYNEPPMDFDKEIPFQQITKRQTSPLVRAF